MHDKTKNFGLSSSFKQVASMEEADDIRQTFKELLISHYPYRFDEVSHSLIRGALAAGVDPNFHTHPDQRDDFKGNTLAMIAAGNGDIKSLNSLVEYGANFDIENDSEQKARAIYYAIKFAHKHGDEAALFLINQGVDLSDHKTEGDSGLSIFTTAVVLERFEIAKALLATGKVDINDTNKYGDTALTLSILYNLPKSVQFLLDNGASLNVAGGQRTPASVSASKQASAARDVEMEKRTKPAEPRAENAFENARQIAAMLAKAAAMPTNKKAKGFNNNP